MRLYLTAALAAAILNFSSTVGAFGATHVPGRTGGNSLAARAPFPLPHHKGSDAGPHATGTVNILPRSTGSAKHLNAADAENDIETAGKGAWDVAQVLDPNLAQVMDPNLVLRSDMEDTDDDFDSLEQRSPNFHLGLGKPKASETDTDPHKEKGDPESPLKTPEKAKSTPLAGGLESKSKQSTCGPAKCKGADCPILSSPPPGSLSETDGNDPPTEKGSIPAARTTASGSLLARSLVPRAPYQELHPNNVGRYVQSPGSRSTLLLSSIDRYPESLGETGMTVSTSGILMFDQTIETISRDPRYTSKDGFKIQQGPLSGCTGVYIVSESGVFYAHYWESLAFDASPRDFQLQVTTPLKDGLDWKANNHPRTPIQRVQSSLYGRRALFQNAEVFIMTPKDEHDNVPEYASKIKTLASTIKKMLPGSVTRYHLYEKENDGIYTAKIPGNDDYVKYYKHNNQYVAQPPYRGARAVYFYENMVHKHQPGDAYALFEYNKNQRVVENPTTRRRETQAGWRLYMGSQKMGEQLWTPPRTPTPPPVQGSSRTGRGHHGT